MTVFEKIVKGEIPCHKVWEDAAHLAFLDIRPVAPGHTLVIPKHAIDPISTMPEADYLKLWGAAKKVAELLRSRITCQRVCMAVVGFEVPHVHIHLIPARSIDDFPWPGGKLADAADLKKIAQRLRSD